MTVEIRALPPPKDSSILEGHPEKAAAFEALKTITPNLFFPKPDEHPILPLPGPDREKQS
jgi:hypothetical protein